MYYNGISVSPLIIVLVSVVIISSAIYIRWWNKRANNSLNSIHPRRQMSTDQSVSLISHHDSSSKPLNSSLPSYPDLSRQKGNCTSTENFAKKVWLTMAINHRKTAHSFQEFPTCTWQNKINEGSQIYNSCRWTDLYYKVHHLWSISKRRATS